MLAEVMGVSVDYDDGNKCMHTHPLLMPKVESEQIVSADDKVLKKAAIVVPSRLTVTTPKKGMLRGVLSRSQLRHEQCRRRNKGVCW